MNDKPKATPAELLAVVLKYAIWGRHASVLGLIFSLPAALLLGVHGLRFILPLGACLFLFLKIQDTAKKLQLALTQPELVALSGVAPMAMVLGDTKEETGPLPETNLPIVTVRVAEADGELKFQLAGRLLRQLHAAVFLNFRTERLASDIGVYQDDRLLYTIRSLMRRDGKTNPVVLVSGTQITEQLFPKDFPSGSELRFPFEGGEEGFLSNGG